MKARRSRRTCIGRRMRESAPLQRSPPFDWRTRAPIGAHHAVRRRDALYTWPRAYHQLVLTCLPPAFRTSRRGPAHALFNRTGGSRLLAHVFASYYHTPVPCCAQTATYHTRTTRVRDERARSVPERTRRSSARRVCGGQSGLRGG